MALYHNYQYPRALDEAQRQAGQGRFAIDLDEDTLASIRLHTSTGRPLGNDTLFDHCEKIAGRPRKAVLEINK